VTVRLRDTNIHLHPGGWIIWKGGFVGGPDDGRPLEGYRCIASVEGLGEQIFQNQVICQLYYCHHSLLINDFHTVDVIFTRRSPQRHVPRNKRFPKAPHQRSTGALSKHSGRRRDLCQYCMTSVDPYKSPATGGGGVGVYARLSRRQLCFIAWRRARQRPQSTGTARLSRCWADWTDSRTELGDSGPQIAHCT